MRTDGSAKTYLLFSQLLKEFDREDLENLWKLVKAKHGNTRPEEGYKRVLWCDLKTMFEHHIEDEVWRSLQGKKVLLWRLYDSCGVHFVRFEDMHVYMLVEKRYPLTPITITDMLNKKLKSDYWNEIIGDDGFNVGNTKAKSIRDPRIKLAHKTVHHDDHHSSTRVSVVVVRLPEGWREDAGDDEEGNGKRGNEGAGGSADNYWNMSAGDWQVQQAR
ncbi:hypothetical protein Tco_0733620 [Tanacetum coccineum]